MSTSTRANGPRMPWWVDSKVVKTLLIILVALALVPLALMLYVRLAWRRARLRRAIRRAWPAAVRFLVEDDDGEWGVLLRGEWLPRYASVTILVPQAGEDSRLSAEERLASKVLSAWGLHHKEWGYPVAVVVMPGKEPLAVHVTRDLRSPAQSDSARLRQRLDTLVAVARATIPPTLP